MELGITVSPSFWEGFATTLGNWKQHRLGLLKHHKKHHRGFIARRFHQMKKYMWKSYKYIEDELYSEFS